MSSNFTYIVSLTGLGFTVLGVAMWRLHVLLEEAAGRLDQLEMDMEYLSLVFPKPGPSVVEDPDEGWGC